jgi:hypothetical protein
MQLIFSVRISTRSEEMLPKPPTITKHSFTLKLNMFGKMASVLMRNRAGVGLRLAPMDVDASIPFNRTASKFDPDGM